MSRCNCLPSQTVTAKNGAKQRGVSFARLALQRLAHARPWGTVLLPSLAARLRRAAAGAANADALPREISLAANEARSLPATPGTAVVCHSGMVWLTQSGDATDIVLHPGQQFRCASSAHLVVSPLRGAAQLRLDD